MTPGEGGEWSYGDSAYMLYSLSTKVKEKFQTQETPKITRGKTLLNHDF